MSTDTKEEMKQIKNKLEYIGLDLENIPEFVKQYPPLKFKPSKSSNLYGQESLKIYQYIDVRKIQILLTPENRLNSLEEKYQMAMPLYTYLEPRTEEDILRHTTFLKMLKEVEIERINIIEEEQKELNKKIPFKVKYANHYLWQIFYDTYTDQYFMIVTTEDKNYEAFFYLLKEQIKSFKAQKSHKIFVPIFYPYYENEFLKKSELEDIEKYLWLFTKDWPNIYDVEDKKKKRSIHIVGNTYVYEKIKSPYNIKLESKEEANKFYKLIKALFIMQTELPHYYQFETKISQNAGLEFLFCGRVIEYENLARVIKEEVVKHQENITKKDREWKKIQEELQKIKEQCSKKEKEYLYKEKQIATYLECKKTFFGKIKYFFKSKKIKNVQVDASVSQEESMKKQEEPERFILEKEFYTIEDLIEICKKADEIENKLKNAQLDKNAMKNKLEYFERKVENATCYIKEIDNHKKSIFEFWKFTNKDEALGLMAPEESKEEKTPKLISAFDYEEDIEELGIKWDEFQRKEFTKEECDSIYLTSTKLLKYIQEETISEKEAEELKKQAQEKYKLLSKEEFDIFGTVAEDKTKIQSLANKKHRENKKNAWRILEINNNTTEEEIGEQIAKRKECIAKAIEKSNLPADLSIYIPSEGKLSMNHLEIRIY